MLRSTMATFQLTGTWSGYYEQSGCRHGISMQVVQRGQSFVGAMRDEDTVLASRELLRTRPAGGGTEMIGEAEVLSTLPERSIVEGEVTGRTVAFVKQYQGTSTTSIRVGNRKTVSIEVPDHQVSYRGALDASGEEMVGTWSIPSRGNGRSQRGRFVLRRRPPPADGGD
jgi:hypothetical protein